MKPTNNLNETEYQTRKNIIKIIHLGIYLNREDIEKSDKVAEIKAALNNCEITPEEAVDLVIEFC